MIELKEILLVTIIGVLVGCIPLTCCILTNVIAEWQVDRKRKG